MPRKTEPPAPFSAESVPLVSPARIPTDPTKTPGMSFRVRTGVGRPQAPDTGVKGARTISRARQQVGPTPAQAVPAPAAGRPEKAMAPAALRHGRHRRGRLRVVLLLGLAAALALGVLSLVRVAPDSGPGTAEAEPRHPATLTAEPSAGVSATVVAPPSASRAPASAAPSTRPTPSSTGANPGRISGTGAGTSPAPPAARPTGTPRAAGRRTPAAPEAPAVTTAPAPAPTPTPAPAASTTTPPPDDKGLCVPVLGVCLKLR
ncbi:hypothetical protein ACPCI1_03345 [Streptomyces seoulensis]|uniref:hypothetical protein n=1 Tax=Streptomyces seoulensis TaxID=73044 RepID=UPI003C2F49B5